MSYAIPSPQRRFRPRWAFMTASMTTDEPFETVRVRRFPIRRPSAASAASAAGAATAHTATDWAWPRRTGVRPRTHGAARVRGAPRVGGDVSAATFARRSCSCSVSSPGTATRSSPSPTAVTVSGSPPPTFSYPVLKRLTRDGLVLPSHEEKRVFSLTEGGPRGRRGRARILGLSPGDRPVLLARPPWPCGRRVARLGAAVWQVSHFKDPEQLAAAAAI